MNTESIFSNVFHTAKPAKPENGILGQRGRALWERVLRLGRRAPRRLRLCESLPLGERRFVAVVEFEQSRFLVGGTSASLVLLARLEKNADEITSSAAVPTNIPAAVQH